MKIIAYGLFAALMAAVLAGCTNPSPEELRTTGISEFQVGRNERAQELFTRVLTKYPTDPDSWYYLGRISHSERFYERAIYCYKCAIDADPGYEPARFYLDKAEKEVPQVAPYLQTLPKQPLKILP